MTLKTSLSLVCISVLGIKSAVHGRFRNTAIHGIDDVEVGSGHTEASFSSIGYDPGQRNTRHRKTNEWPIQKNMKQNERRGLYTNKGRRGSNHSGGGHEATRLVVQYSDEFAHKRVIRQATHVYQDLDTDNEIIMTCDSRCVEELENDNAILDVSVDHMVEEYGNVPDGAPRTLAEILPVGLKMIQADQLPVGPEETVICIADTGLAIGHPDFNTDFITGTHTYKDNGVVWRWDEDFRGHGTHVAGTIAAFAGNGIGVAGAGNFRLHIVRALGDDGRGYESDVRRAVEQCRDAGAHIINLSLGGPSMSSRSENLYSEIVETDGVLFVAAAGNQGSSKLFYPASHPSVISVAAVFEWNMYWGGSNWGTQIEVAAPGFNVLSSTVSTSSIQTSDFGYAAYHIDGTAHIPASGNIVYCGEGDYVCNDALDAVCLMIRDSQASLEDMLANCELGGAKGAIIFNTETTNNYNWSISGTAGIPAVRVTYKVGVELVMNQQLEFVSMGDSDGDGLEYTYAHFTGTSMASPHVAAAAALAWSYNPSCNNHQIRYALAKTALDLDPAAQPGCDNDHGYGLVQAMAANQYLLDNDCSQWTTPISAVGGCTILGELN